MQCEISSEHLEARISYMQQALALRGEALQSASNHILQCQGLDAHKAFKLLLSKQLGQAIERLSQRRSEIAVDIALGTVGRQAQQDSDVICKICFQAPFDCVLVPCGHYMLCSACARVLEAQRLAHCPLCRTPIERHVRDTAG